MTNLAFTPLFALLTALSLLPLEGCIQENADQSAVTEQPPAIVAEYGVPLPESESVTDDWFSDAAFIGHSLIYGFSGYSGLNTADYYHLSGSSVQALLSSGQVNLPGGGIGTLRSGLSKHTYHKVYLMMGINEIAGNLDKLRGDYSNLIELVRSYNPDAEIYVLSVLPVSARKDAGGDFTIARITAYNDMLMELCKEAKCWYVDLYTHFADENGFLPSSASSDGIHLKPGQYVSMLDYIRTHTAEMPGEETGA